MTLLGPALLAVLLSAVGSAAGARDLRSVERLDYDCSSDITRRRTTLFGNGTVRLRTWPPGAEKSEMRLRELSPEQLAAYLNRLREIDLSESEATRESAVGEWIQRCTLELDLDEGEDEDTTGQPEGPTRFEFGRFDSVSLALSRVVTIAEEITAWVEEQIAVGDFPPGYEPRPGDVLERKDGVLFEVVAFTSDQRGIELWGIDQPLVVYVLREELIGEFVGLVERP